MKVKIKCSNKWLYRCNRLWCKQRLPQISRLLTNQFKGIIHLIKDQSVLKRTLWKAHQSISSWLMTKSLLSKVFPSLSTQSYRKVNHQQLTAVIVKVQTHPLGWDAQYIIVKNHHSSQSFRSLVWDQKCSRWEAYSISD